MNAFTFSNRVWGWGQEPFFGKHLSIVSAKQQKTVPDSFTKPYSVGEERRKTKRKRKKCQAGTLDLLKRANAFTNSISKGHAPSDYFPTPYQRASGKH